MVGNEAVLVVACGSGTASTAGVSSYPTSCRQGLLISFPWECFQPLVTPCGCHEGRTLEGSHPAELPVGPGDTAVGRVSTIHDRPYGASVGPHSKAAFWYNSRLDQVMRAGGTPGPLPKPCSCPQRART